MNNYAKEMLECFKRHKFTGEDLWIEFTNTFRVHSIKVLSATALTDWVEFLLERGVHVKRGRNIKRAKALCECLTAETFIPKSSSKEDEVTESSRKKEQ